MLRKITVLLSLVLTLGFAVTTSAAAQTEDLSGPADMEGFESGYIRTYMPDFSSMIDTIGTPGAEIPEFDEEGVLTVTTSVFTFDNADNAEKGMETTTDAAEQEAGDDLTSEEIDDLGDQAVRYFGETDAGDGSTVSSNILVVQDSERIYIVMVGGGELEEGATQAQDIAQFMVDAKPTTDEVTFNADGTSTGGAFDRMPTAEDTDLLGGLTPFMDMDMSDPSSGLGN